MNKEKMVAAGINYDEGVNRFAGKEVLYEKYVHRFPDDPEFDNMKKALDQGDIQTAFRCAHTMKGTTGNLSFNQLLESLIPMVEALRAANLDQAVALFPAVETEYHRVIEAITD